MALILVVDDDRQVRAMIRKTLAKAGHEVVEAENGAVALDEYRKNKPTLIVSDILMPEKGGLALLADVRKLDSSMPFIAISGGGAGGRMNFLASAASVPGVRTLHKPFSADELTGLVREMLMELGCQ